MALIYNNWIFYLPTSAELEAEFELEPVMCSTTRNVGKENILDSLVSQFKYDAIQSNLSITFNDWLLMCQHLGDYSAQNQCKSDGGFLPRLIGIWPCYNLPATFRVIKFQILQYPLVFVSCFK